MAGFSRPLSVLASHFVETWNFSPAVGGCQLVRRFELYPRGRLGAVALRLIAPMLRRAVERHLREMNASR